MWAQNPMKLYYFPGACSLAVHIILCEIGEKFALSHVDLSNKRTQDDEDFLLINPKGFVPALELDSGDVMTECPVILQYLADQNPDKHLAPLAGSMARYRLMEWLNYISSDLQKGFAPLFNPETEAEVRETVHANLGVQFNYISAQLSKSKHIAGERFSIADALLFTVLRWSQFVEVDLSGWPVLNAYLRRVAQMPAVQVAMDGEEWI